MDKELLKLTIMRMDAFLTGMAELIEEAEESTEDEQYEFRAIMDLCGTVEAKLVNKLYQLDGNEDGFLNTDSYDDLGIDPYPDLSNMVDIMDTVIDQ